VPNTRVVFPKLHRALTRTASYNIGSKYLSGAVMYESGSNDLTKYNVENYNNL
jgi:hypothetical protein